MFAPIDDNDDSRCSTVNDFVRPDPMAQLDAVERKRQEYIKELIVTEEAYIVDMQLVHEVTRLFDIFFSFLLNYCYFLSNS